MQSFVYTIADPALRIEARLTDSAGNPLGGKTVYFYVSTDGYTWTLVGTATTDSSGKASTTYTASVKTWFKAEFKGDDYYEPSSATAVWEPYAAPQPACGPIFRTGIEFLDRVLFCIGGYGITVAVVLIALFVLLVLLRRSR